MRLLVLGSASQLGRKLAALLEQSGVTHKMVDTRKLELPRKQDVIRLISRFKPDQIINVASYSNLKEAEENEAAAKLCDRINTEGVSVLAELCASLDIPLIHHSSSAVFDGRKPRPYEESDETGPVSRYGLSKWYGERAIRETLREHVIIRTDWLFSVHRDHFFRAHIETCKAQRGHTEVMDHRFSPTPAMDAARVFLAVARQVDCHPDVWGTYHYCALQPMSEAHFVDTFLHEAMHYDPQLAGLEERLDISVRAPTLPYIANTALNSQKIMETFGIKQRSRSGEVSRVLKAIYGIVDDGENNEPSVIRDEIPEPENPAPAGTRRAARTRTASGGGKSGGKNGGTGTKSAAKSSTEQKTKTARQSKTALRSVESGRKGTGKSRPSSPSKRGAGK